MVPGTRMAMAAALAWGITAAGLAHGEGTVLAAAQDAPPPAAAPPAAAPPPAPAEPVAPANPPQRIRFNFKGASFDQVLDFFSRATGLPVVRETDVPAGTLDYRSPDDYDLPEALRVLNIILQARGVMLRADQNMLFLQKLQAMQQENIPTFHGPLPDSVTDDQVVTVVRALERAQARPLAEKLKALVAEYGSVMAMEQQNALVITETAGNIRRLLGIIADLDRDDPEGSVQVFAIRHARAKALMEPIKALLSEKVQKFVINQQGQQVKIEEESMPGLSVSFDERTNTIIAKGQQNRLDKLGETIGLLDVPASGASRSLRSFELERLSAADGVARLNQLFERQPPETRPIIIADATRNRLTLIGSEESAADAAMLLRDLDGAPGGAEGAAGQGHVTRVLALSHARSDELARLLLGLLTARQQATTKIMPGPDGRSLVVAGRGDDVEMLGSLVAALDQPTTPPGGGEPAIHVRPLRFADAQQVSAALNQVLPGMISKASGQRLSVRVVPSPGANALLLVGLESDLAEVESLIDPLDRRVAIDQPQVRTVLLKFARAETVAPIVRELLTDRPLLSPSEVAPWQRMELARAEQEQRRHRGAEPRIAVDSRINAVIVTAPPPMLDVAQQMIEQLDVDPATVVTTGSGLGAPPDGPGAGPGARSVRVLTVANADAAALAANLEAVLVQPDAATAGDLPPVIRVDAQSNSLIIRATDGQFQIITDLVSRIDKATIASSRQMRLIPIDPAKGAAADLAAALQRLIDRGAGGSSRVEVLSVDDLIKRQRERQEKTGPPTSMRPSSTRDRFTAEAQRTRRTEEVSGQRSEVSGQRSEVSGQRSEVSGQRSEVRGQKSEVRGQLQGSFPHAVTSSASHPLTSHFAPIVALLTTVLAAPEPELHGDAADISIAVDPATNSLIVVGSERAVNRIAALAAELQRQLPTMPGTIRVVTLPEGVDAATLSGLLTQMLQQMTPAAGQRGDLSRRVAVLADPGGRALLVACNDADFQPVAELITALARPMTPPTGAVRTITLQRADAGTVAAAVQRFYDDRAKVAADVRGQRAQPRRVSVVGDPTSNTLLVAASEDDFEEVKIIVAQLDTPQATRALDFRVYALRHARATEIQGTIERLIADLTWNQGPVVWWVPQNQQQRGRGTLAVRADARLNVLIATGEGDKFQLLEQLIDVLDAAAPEGEQLVVRLHRVQHAALDTVAEVIRESYAGAVRRQWWEPVNPREVKVRTDARTNTLILSGPARQLDEVAALIASVDVKPAGGEQQLQVLPVEFARAVDLASTLTQFLASRAAATNAARPTATIHASDSTNTLLISAAADDMATLRDLLTKLDQPNVTGDRSVEIMTLRDGAADEIGRIVREQFSQRARVPAPGGGAGAGGQGVIVTADARTNSLIINAPRPLLAQVKALIERLDAPRASDEVVIRTYALEGSRADEAVRILRDALRLDARGETRGTTVRLEGAAPDSPGVEVKARVVADRRSNSLIVTATPASIPVIESLIAKLDQVPAASPVEYRIVPLRHAAAADVAMTLRAFTRSTGAATAGAEPEPRIDYNRFENTLVIAATADQFKQIRKILEEIDQPSKTMRRTDFVRLQFAQAQKIQEALSVFYGAYAIEADTPGKQNVRIVADPASNSLVISADETEWEGIKSLLGKLDSAEYDASLQLKVMPLTHADASSVARAINEAFQSTPGSTPGASPGAPAPDGRQPDARTPGSENRPPGAAGGARPESPIPTVLVRPDEWVRAAAEPQTNAVIVSASRQNLEKVERIISQLDVADYAKLPPPQIIPVTAGTPGGPEQIAVALKAIYAQATDTRGGKALRIVGDRASNALIVRADESDVAQIRALAEALQQHASTQGLSVHVLKLQSAPARRVATAITQAFQAKATQASLPLSIQVDSLGNNLVVASTGPMFDEIAAVAGQMDAMAPPPGQSIFIIELENISPEAARRVIETIGLDKPLTDATTTRVVSEPIKVSVLAGRNAIIIVASPGDRETLVALLKAMDAEPKFAEAQVRLVKLKNAQAAALAAILNQVLAPPDQAPPTADNALARAIREQVRRLAVRRDGVDQPDLKLDLTRPVRVLADPALNALVISSTAENVTAIEQVARMFDELPITDAATVQLFPLQNIAADQFVRIVRELFAQGKKLGTIPGTKLAALPGGMVGKALLDEVAITADARTNTVIVAGKEDSVALVEVLARRIDSDVATGWLEPRVIPLRFADADELAATLQAVLVEGSAELPESAPLQLQVGRLRMARMGPDGGKLLESDVFQPMNRLVIRGDPQLNALILVGTPANLEIVTELVKMLDTEAASPNALVRIYPLKHASAARLAGTLTRLFDQQLAAKAIRPEDRVAATSDERTNALIVSTSPRSFAVLEKLLESLDTTVEAELNELRRVELKHASATRLAGMIQQLMNARLERLRRIAPETADEQRVAVVADPRTNSLVVAASAESYDVVRRLAAELDTAATLDASQVTVLPMSKGNVERVAAAINQIMQRRYADMPAELGRSLRPLVLTDPRSNSLLVAANPEDVATITDLVAKIEAVPANPAVGLHVVDAGSMRPELLAPRLQQLMRERAQSLGTAQTPSDRVSIEPHPASNSLIVAASDENLEIIRGLVDALAAAEVLAGGGGGGEFEIIPLATSRAADMVELINSLYAAEENRKRGPNTVRVSADRRLNALLVSAAAQDVAAVKALVARLDGAKPAGVIEIRYIALQSANAVETVSLIQNVLSGRGIDGRRTSQQSTVLQYLRQIERDRAGADPVRPPGDDPPEMEVSAAVRESITLTPDLRTNTIIVSAPRDSMRMIEQMIRDLDASTLGSQTIRIFKLTNADALAMAQILTDLFNLRRQGELYVLKPREGAGDLDVAPGSPERDGAAAPGTSDLGLGDSGLTAVPDPRQQLAITVDSRTNSLLVSGTAAYLDLVERVVKELDAQEATERVTRIYRLNNAAAAEVARVVGGFVKEEQQKLLSTLSVDQRGSAARLLEREITIVGDDKSNSVLVSSSPRYQQQVQTMIDELDVDPPQVLIQVLLAEVTLDASDDWGVDFAARGSSGGLSISGGFGLATAFVTGVGLPNLAIASSDFDLLIRALRAQGRLQVLSNPSVMAANNEVARIQIGETIRLPESTSITAGGNQQSSVVPEDIGVILSVTPSINPGGFVRMSINPEISELSARTTRINEQFESPIITRRTADTTVTVKDGQTIVLGGLISDRYERRERKVPFFGDIPLIGLLFRNHSETAAKTELLIVLTPHVIVSPAQLDAVDRMTNDEIDRLSLPDEIKRSIRRSVLEGTGGLYDHKGRRIDQPTTPVEQVAPPAPTPSESQGDEPDS